MFQNACLPVCRSYEDDFEAEDDSPAPTPKSDDSSEGLGGIGVRPAGQGGVAPGSPAAPVKKAAPATGAGDDIYDFTTTNLGY